jgi:hypothetical protein
VGWTTGVRFPVGVESFSLRQCVQTGSDVFYPMSIGVSFPGYKATGPYSWSLPSSAEVKNAQTHISTQFHLWILYNSQKKKQRLLSGFFLLWRRACVFFRNWTVKYGLDTFLSSKSYCLRRNLADMIVQEWKVLRPDLKTFCPFFLAILNITFTLIYICY